VHLVGFIIRIASAISMIAINFEVRTLNFPDTTTLYWFPIAIFNNKVTSQPSDGSR